MALEFFNKPIKLLFYFRHLRTAHNFHGRMKKNQIDSVLMELDSPSGLIVRPLD